MSLRRRCCSCAKGTVSLLFIITRMHSMLMTSKRSYPSNPSKKHKGGQDVRKSWVCSQCYKKSLLYLTGLTLHKLFSRKPLKGTCCMLSVIQYSSSPGRRSLQWEPADERQANRSLQFFHQLKFRNGHRMPVCINPLLGLPTLPSLWLLPPPSWFFNLLSTEDRQRRTQ